MYTFLSGAAAMKARFENPSNFKRRTSSVDREGGRKHSTANMLSKFEMINSEQAAPIKRNFVVSSILDLILL